MRTCEPFLSPSSSFNIRHQSSSNTLISFTVYLVQHFFGKHFRRTGLSFSLTACCITLHHILLLPFTLQPSPPGTTAPSFNPLKYACTVIFPSAAVMLTSGVLLLQIRTTFTTPPMNTTHLYFTVSRRIFLAGSLKDCAALPPGQERLLVSADHETLQSYNDAGRIRDLGCGIPILPSSSPSPH